MVTRISAVAAALLAAIVIHQYTLIGQLRGELADAQTSAVARARASVADSMEGQGAEVQRVLAWLNDLYQSNDGLQRPGGLWIEGHPDFVGISYWVFEVYLRDRLSGMSEDQARVAVVAALKQSSEWQTKHQR